MGTIIWLLLTTGIGYFVGVHWFEAPYIGAGIGFLIGLCLRVGASDALGDIGDSVVDSIDFD